MANADDSGASRLASSPSPGVPARNDLATDVTWRIVVTTGGDDRWACRPGAARGCGGSLMGLPLRGARPSNPV